MPIGKVNYCIVCDDLRPEPFGKASVLGFLGVVPYVKVGVSDFQQHINQVLFIFSVTDVEGPVNVRMELIDPDGKQFQSMEQEKVPVQKDSYNNIGLGMRNLKLPKAGGYKVR